MNVRELLTEIKGEGDTYVPCNMPVSLEKRIKAIAVAEGLSRSKVMVAAARLFVENYGAGSPQEASGALVEGGDDPCGV